MSHLYAHACCRQAGRWQESARILQQQHGNAVLQHQYTTIVIHTHTFCKLACKMHDRQSQMHACCRRAGRWEESNQILQQLHDNAVLQHQYATAAELQHQMAMEALHEVTAPLHLPAMPAYGHNINQSMYLLTIKAMYYLHPMPPGPWMLGHSSTPNFIIHLKSSREAQVREHVIP